MKCGTEAIVYLKRNRADSERIISKYMKISDAKLAATEFDFVSSLMPDYIAPTLEGIKLILENFGKEYPDAPGATQRVRRQLDHGPAEKQKVCGRIREISNIALRNKSPLRDTRMSKWREESDDAYALGSVLRLRCSAPDRYQSNSSAAKSETHTDQLRQHRPDRFHLPFLIAEQESFFQREGIHFQAGHRRQHHRHHAGAGCRFDGYRSE